MSDEPNEEVQPADTAEASAGETAEAQAAETEQDAAEEGEAQEAAEGGETQAGGRPDLGDPEEDPEARARLKKVLESLIFVSDRTVSPAQLARATKIRVAIVRPVLKELMEEFQGRGLQLVEVAGGYQFRSSAECSPWVRDWVAQKPVRLSRAQLETLALVAYRQPITRPEIDDVRGVDTGSAVRVLLDRSLIKILGRKDEPGRPLLYGTSPHFLEFFGMKSLKDLPTLREFTELSEENRALFKHKTGEAVEEAEAELAAAEEAARREEEEEAAAAAAEGELEEELAAATDNADDPSPEDAGDDLEDGDDGASDEDDENGDDAEEAPEEEVSAPPEA